MAYDPEFYRLYREYLREPTVRENHDRIFRMFDTMLFEAGIYDDDSYASVIDIGCGLCEFAQHFPGDRDYVGVDKNDPEDMYPFVRSDDYMALDFLAAANEELEGYIDVFVSLFSVEACYPAAERYAFYERLFAETEARFVLVAGFYYESKADQETVGEAGGIVSYQTIEPLEFHRSDTFDEVRILLRTPSAMFGPDVVEVWKVLRRK